MIQIRYGVFETNSSSVHSMIVCSKHDYDDWVNGDVLLNLYYDDDYMWKKWNTDNRCFTKDVDEIPPMFVSPADAARYDINYPYPPAETDTWGNVSLDYLDKDGVWCTRKFITFEEYTKAFLYDFSEFFQKYTSESGDNIVVMGYYGHD